MATSEVKIFSTTYCPYCVQAKRLLSSLAVQFTEVLLDDKPELRAQLSAENGGWRTVPMIFVGDEFIGGFNDMKALHDKGELLPKINVS